MTEAKEGAETRPWIVPACIAGLGGLVLLPLLGSTGLWDPYESLAAEVAREAAHEGAWLPLAFDGRPLPGLPALFFWLEALVLAVAGTSEWAVRLPLALLSIAWLVGVSRLVTRVIGREAGLLAPPALATSAFFLAGARHTSPDLAAAMLLCLAILQALVVLVPPAPPARRDSIVMQVLAAALLPAGGLLPLLVLAAGLALGPALGNIPGRSLRRLAPSGWGWLPWALAGAWIAGGLLTSGADFLSGILTVHPFAHSTLRAFSPPPGTSFAMQLAQAGHMAYPWFIALPASLLWLAPPRAEGDACRRPSLHMLLAVPALYLVVTSLGPGYLPLDTICAAPPLVIASAWGLVRVRLLEAEDRFRTLLVVGGILVMLGAGSQGVDFFWNPKLSLEAAGYAFDRVYPELGWVAKGFHTAVAILVGASAAPTTFLRRRSSIMAVAMLAAALALAGFEVVHVFRTVEPYMSVGPLARAYAKQASGRDRLAALDLDPQVRGGHVFYFRRAMKDEGGLESLPRLVDEAAGRGRLVIVTSHVRDLYDEAYSLTCGQRITPLNEERRWYSISAIESAVHVPWYRIVVPGGRAEARIERPFSTGLTNAGKKVMTFLGWNVSLGGAGGSDPVPPGGPLGVRRSAWLSMDLFWRAEAPLETGWRVILDAAGEGPAAGSVLKGHHDPACGRYPTHLWKPGQVIRDRYFLYVPVESAPGPYRLRTGFYRDSERLRVDVRRALAPVADQTSILLGTVDVF